MTAEQRYELAMARFCEDRGFYELALSHIIHAKDCPAGCQCKGCQTTRAEVKEARERKEKRRILKAAGANA